MKRLLNVAAAFGLRSGLRQCGMDVFSGFNVAAKAATHKTEPADEHGRKKGEEQLPQQLKPLAIEQYFAAGLKPGADKTEGRRG